MRNIYDILSNVDFEKRCEQYALGFYRDTDTPTMTKFRQESMKEFCFDLMQAFYEIVLQDHWQEITAVDSKLEHTRKMLKIAIGAIKTIKYSKKSDAINLRHKANKALIEIYKIKDQTALEQKDVK